MKSSHPIGVFTWLGAAPVLGVMVFAADTIYRRTSLIWNDGVSVIGFIEPHSPVVLFWALFTGLALAWTIVFVIRAIAKRAIGSPLNLALVATFALGVGVDYIPYSSWLLAATYVRGAENAPPDWLIYAAGHGETRLLNRLIEHGADVNALNSNGGSALRAAAYEGKIETALILLSKGAVVDHRSRMTGATPLIEAAEGNHLDMVKLLVEHGADPDAKTFDGCTALTFATRNRNSLMADFLRANMR